MCQKLKKLHKSKNKVKLATLKLPFQLLQPRSVGGGCNV